MSSSSIYSGGRFVKMIYINKPQSCGLKMKYAYKFLTLLSINILTGSSWNISEKKVGFVSKDYFDSLYSKSAAH